MKRLVAAVAVVPFALLLAACSGGVPSCSGSFDGELTADAEGASSKVAAAESWASTTDAPDDGWTETEDGATSGDWVVTVAETEDGGWAVLSQRCA